MHAWAEHYDTNYRTRPNYRMKPWRQECLRIWLERCLADMPERGIVHGHKFLDVGCGRAESVDIAREMGFESRGCELAPVCAERDDVDLLHDGAKSLPYPDREFDVVTCMDVLEHVEPAELDQTIRSIWRVCRHRALIGVPGKREQNPPEHLTLEGESWWHDKLFAATQAGVMSLGSMRIPQHKQPYWYFEVRR